MTKVWNDEEQAALVNLSDKDFFATVMGQKPLSDFTRVVEETGVLDQKEAPLTKRESKHD